MLQEAYSQRLCVRSNIEAGRLLASSNRISHRAPSHASGAFGSAPHAAQRTRPGGWAPSLRLQLSMLHGHVRAAAASQQQGPQEKLSVQRRGPVPEPWRQQSHPPPPHQQHQHAQPQPQPWPPLPQQPAQQQQPAQPQRRRPPLQRLARAHPASPADTPPLPPQQQHQQPLPPPLLPVPRPPDIRPPGPPGLERMRVSSRNSDGSHTRWPALPYVIVVEGANDKRAVQAATASEVGRHQPGLDGLFM